MCFTSTWIVVYSSMQMWTPWLQRRWGGRHRQVQPKCFEALCNNHAAFCSRTYFVRIDVLLRQRKITKASHPCPTTDTIKHLPFSRVCHGRLKRPTFPLEVVRVGIKGIAGAASAQGRRPTSHLGRPIVAQDIFWVDSLFLGGSVLALGHGVAEGCPALGRLEVEVGTVLHQELDHLWW